MISFTRPIRHNVTTYHAPKMKRFGIARPVMLPPSNGMREPGSNIAHHTTNVGLVQQTGSSGGRAFLGTPQVFYSPQYTGGPGQFPGK